MDDAALAANRIDDVEREVGAFCGYRAVVTDFAATLYGWYG